MRPPRSSLRAAPLISGMQRTLRPRPLRLALRPNDSRHWLPSQTQANRIQPKRESPKDFARCNQLLLLLEAAHGVDETGQGKSKERPAFKQDRTKISDADGGEPQPIDLPGNGVQERGPAEPYGKRFERIKHRAGKHKDEVEDAGHAIEDIVALRLESENRVKEKPARGANGHAGQEQRQFRPVHTDAEEQAADGERERGLHNGDEDVEDDFSEQVFAAAHRIGEHFVEDAVVAVQKKRPGSIGSDGEAGHGQNSREKKLVVVHVAEPGGSAERGIDAYTKDQHVKKRKEKIPEDKGKIRGANFRFAIHNCG